MLLRLLRGVRRSRATPGQGTGEAPGSVQVEDGNPLALYFANNRGRLIYKWLHYFDIYHRHFKSFRDRSPVIMEIGVFHGGSLEMWHDYFGPGTRVVGIDIDPRCREFENDRTSILIGDQADRAFLAEVRKRAPHVDILIDDGGHSMAQQITSFEELYPHVQPSGVYLCEDMHTSFFPEWGGGYRREGTFLQYSQELIERLYYWHHARSGTPEPDGFTRSTHSLHFYESVLVIEKRPMQPPVNRTTGTPSF
jgi:hypothetical protein